MMSRAAALSVVSLSLITACSNKAFLGHYAGAGYTAPTAYTSAEVRVIEQRPHPTIPGRDVVCTEPTPDVAEALSTVAQLSANGGNGTVQAGIAGSFATQEAAQELAGRSTALLGLRDGLFRACEAYANGAIGDDAYALILSRYGQLMVTLFLGQDAASAAAATASAAFASTDLKLELQASSGGSGSNTPSSGSGQQGSGTTQPGSNGGQTKQTTGSHPASVAPVSLLHKIALVAGSTAPVVPVTETPAAPVTPAQTPPTKTQPAQNAQKESPPSAAIADAIGNMQKSYLDIDTSPMQMLHLLFVACVNENDPTRPVYNHMVDTSGHVVLDALGRPARAENKFLSEVCSVNNLKSWVGLLSALHTQVTSAQR